MALAPSTNAVASDIPTGDCDCDGNQQDAAGVCGGDCTSDIDGDGVCDTDEVPGCDDPLADNYDPNATDNDGSCTYLPASFDGLVAEAYELNSVEQGTHTFRVYAQFSNPNDQLISVYGTASNPISVSTTTTFYQEKWVDRLPRHQRTALRWLPQSGVGQLCRPLGFGQLRASPVSIQSAWTTPPSNAGGALTSDPTAGWKLVCLPRSRAHSIP